MDYPCQMAALDRGVALGWHHAARIRTPVLVQHAEGDRRVPIDQAEQMFTALRHRGVTAVLVRYPHDPHFVSLMGRPSNRIELMRRQLDRFRQHLDQAP